MHFEFPPEILRLFVYLCISTYYDLGHTYSSFEYSLGWIVCKLGHTNCDCGIKGTKMKPKMKIVNNYSL